jgi:hypothetical protein
VISSDRSRPEKAGCAVEFSSYLGSGQLGPARELIALLKSPSIFESALTEIVNEHFGIKSWSIPVVTGVAA